MIPGISDHDLARLAFAAVVLFGAWLVIDGPRR